MAQEPEIARPQERTEFIAGFVEIEENPKPRETHRVGNRSTQVDLIVEKQVALELDGPRFPADQFMDLHRVVGQEPGVKELELERQLLVAPPSPVGIEPDLAMLVVGEIAEELRHLAGPRMVRFGRQLLRVEPQRFKIEGSILRAQHGAGGGQSDKEERGQDTRLHQRK